MDLQWVGAWKGRRERDVNVCIMPTWRGRVIAVITITLESELAGQTPRLRSPLRRGYSKDSGCRFGIAVGLGHGCRL